jgi:glycerol-3-phosphate acyltransferase PlsY
MANGIAAVGVGYLLGAIVPAYIIGKLAGNVNISTEGDGHIGEAVIYRG